ILKGIKNHGTSVYDPDFKMKTFSLVANVKSVPMEFSSSGFGVFASMGYRFGLAVGTTSKKADALAEAMNPGAKSNGRDSYHMNLEYNLGLGPRYGFSIGKAKVFVAAGYEIASIFMFEEGLSLNTS
ncbi:hypothetical protein JNL27_17380, partial [bacterium]|nr:hypothetical protein [bacterium]